VIEGSISSVAVDTGNDRKGKKAIQEGMGKEFCRNPIWVGKRVRGQ
jgi:hypothetical protein